MEVLRLCFPVNLRHTLEELPKSLDETYKRILNEINNANQVHAYRLLQCLAVALRPLRVEELAEVLAFDLTAGGMPKLNADWRWEDQEEAVLSACSSLVSVIIDDGSRVVQFSHFSVKEFLISDRLASCLEEVSKFYIPDEPSHAILAQACLGVLLSLDDRTDNDSIENIPLCRYAAEYWAKHAVVGNVESQIKDALDYFFDMDNPHFQALARIYYQRDLLRVSVDEEPTGVLRPAAPLYFAAWMGLHGAVERLIIKDPQQVTQLGGLYGTPLHASVLGGHIDISRLLTAHGADVNLRCADNWTPLHIASNDGHHEIGRWLLDYGADMNSREKRGWTPLHLAALYGHLQVCRVLLERHAEVDPQDNDDVSTPFLMALERGHPDVARLLLDQNADVHVRDNKRNTPLHFAAYHGYSDVCQILLERNAEVDSQNTDGDTPFLKSWKNRRNADILQLFLDHNADVRVCDGNGYTPLHFAAENGLIELAQTLLERNVEVDPQNEESTPFLRALRYGYLDIARLLLDHDANVHVHDKYGTNPLHFAAENGLLDVAQILLERSVDVNSQNYHGSTPLLLASEFGHPDVVQLLLDHKADLCLCDSDGDTPLHCAAIGGQLETTLLLLKLNVKVNPRNFKGSTPLHCASTGSWRLPEGSAVVVRLLLDYGADVQARDLSGQTASEVACGPEQQEIVRLLTEHAAGRTNEAECSVNA